MAMSDDLWEDIIGGVTSLVNTAGGLGTAAINGRTATNVAGINATTGGSSYGVGGIPTIVYQQPTSAAPAPAQDNSMKNVVYVIGGILVLGLLGGGIALAIKAFSKKD